MKTTIAQQQQNDYFLPETVTALSLKQPIGVATNNGRRIVHESTIDETQRFQTMQNNYEQLKGFGANAHLEPWDKSKRTIQITPELKGRDLLIFNLSEVMPCFTRFYSQHGMTILDTFHNKEIISYVKEQIREDTEEITKLEISQYTTLQQYNQMWREMTSLLRTMNETHFSKATLEEEKRILTTRLTQCLHELKEFTTTITYIRTQIKNGRHFIQCVERDQTNNRLLPQYRSYLEKQKMLGKARIKDKEKTVQAIDNYILNHAYNHDKALATQDLHSQAVGNEELLADAGSVPLEIEAMLNYCQEIANGGSLNTFTGKKDKDGSDTDDDDPPPPVNAQWVKDPQTQPSL